MDHLTLTKTNFFKMIGGEAEINPQKAYQEFIMQVIELCKQTESHQRITPILLVTPTGRYFSQKHNFNVYKL